MARKPTDIVLLQLRFSERLRRQIEAEARKRGHSMNAEIIRLIEEGYARPALMKDITASLRAVFDEAGIKPAKVLEFDPVEFFKKEDEEK